MSRAPAKARPTAPLQLLLALAQGQRLARRVRVVYRDAGGATTTRDVEVLGLAFQEACWYAFVHCQLRHAVRLLRVDRMLDARTTRKRAQAEPPSGFDPVFFGSVEFLEPGAPVAHLASIRLAPPLTAAVRVLFPSAIVERAGRAVLCHVRASRPAALAALAQSLGHGATIVSGPGARQPSDAPQS